MDMTPTERKIQQAALALDAAETQLRIVAEILRKLFDGKEPEPSAWMDVINACERQADFAKRARMELSK